MSSPFLLLSVLLVVGVALFSLTTICTEISVKQKLALWQLIFDSIDVDLDGALTAAEYTHFIDYSIDDHIAEGDGVQPFTEGGNLRQNNVIYDWLVDYDDINKEGIKKPRFPLNLLSFIQHFFPSKIWKYSLTELLLEMEDSLQTMDSSVRNKKKLRDTVFSPIPEQIHLSLATKQTPNAMDAMVVMWITDYNTTDSVVHYSKNASAVLSSDGATNTGGITTYDSGFFGWNGRVHYALMNELDADSIYYYIVGGASAVSDMQSFHTRRESTDENGYRFAIFGDMGSIQLMGWSVAIQMMNDEYENPSRGPYDLFIHVGDLSYAGVSSTRSFQYFWDLWMRMISPLAAHVPWMTTVGNHEKYYNWTSFQHRFVMPGVHSNLAGNANANANANAINFEDNLDLFYYSYDYGPIHFISMCTEEYYISYAPGNSAQYAWLQSDLSRIDRTQTPWVIILGHRPMYSSDLATDSGPLQQYIEPLLIEYKIDVAIWGHMHCVERTFPVSNYSRIGCAEEHGACQDSNVIVNPNATIHLTVGTAGAMIAEQFADPMPAWSAFRSGTLRQSPYGYALLHVFNKTHLYYEFAVETNGKVLDYMWIVKQ